LDALRSDGRRGAGISDAQAMLCAFSTGSPRPVLSCAEFKRRVTLDDTDENLLRTALLAFENSAPHG
jgi:hypothetical protein